MKAIVLARVSDKKQDSNEAQIGRLDSYIKSKNFSPIKIHEITESSSKADRRQFMQIIESIKQSNEPVAFVVDTIDRMQRSFRESVILDDLRKQGKLELHFYRENLIIHKDSNSADLIRWDMGVMFARSYVLQLSDNVKRAQEAMLRKGSYPSKPPIGYKRTPLNDLDRESKTEIVVDHFMAGIVKRTYELYATGAYSMDLLRNKIKLDYGVSWYKSFIDKILKDTFYYGVMTWKGKVYKHAYPQVITRTLFEQVQLIKAGFNKKPFKYAGKPFMYRGLFRCKYCGLAITPDEKKGISYYHCTHYKGKHNEPYITEADITEQIGKLFKRLEIPTDVIEKISFSLNQVHEGKVEFHNIQLKKFYKEKDTLIMMRDNLLTEKLKGRITDDVYDKHYQSITNQIADVDARLSMLQEADDNYFMSVKYLLELASRAYELFIHSKVEERRQLMRLVLSNLEVEGKKVHYDVVKPFDTVLNYADRMAWLPRLDSNQ